MNIILNTSGVVSLTTLTVSNLSGTTAEREYSSEIFSVTGNTSRNILSPPVGSIFEVKFPEYDIIGVAL